MDRLRRARGTQRTTVTKLITSIEELQKDQPDHNALEDMKLRLDEIRELLAEKDEAVLETLLDDDASEEDLEQESESVQQYRSRINRARIAIDNLLTPRLKSPTPSESSYSTALGGDRQRNFKLPKIELRKFNGEYEDWLGRWSQFLKIQTIMERY